MGPKPTVRFSPTFIGCFELNLGVLAYVNAGGQPAVLRDTDGTRLLANGTMPFGLFTHLTYEPVFQAFEPGATLLLVTKGVLEASRGRTHFGVQRLQQVLKDFNPGTASDLCNTVLQQAHNFIHPPWYSPQRFFTPKPEKIDDLTAVALLRTT